MKTSIHDGVTAPEIQPADDFDAFHDFVNACQKDQDELITSLAAAGSIPTHIVASLVLPVIIQRLAEGIPDRERVKAILCADIDLRIPCHAVHSKGGVQ
jgi:hypothetical protein